MFRRFWSTSTSTTATLSSPSAASAASSSDTKPAVTLLSTFTPTLTLHLPPHGYLPHPTPLPIHTAPYTPELPRLPRSLRHRLTTTGTPTFLLSAPTLTTTSSPPCTLAKWDVPWSLLSPSTLHLPAHKSAIDVHTIEGAPRDVGFVWKDDGYRWRWRSEKEVVLEKWSQGSGRYAVAVYVLRAGVSGAVMGGGGWRTGGVAWVDERGVEAVVCVGSLEIVLKRERQRRGLVVGTV